MDETIVPIGTLSKGDEGTVTDGKFNGRRFRIRSIGSTGRTVMVDWTEYGTKGTIFATTLVLNAFGSESWITDQWTGALADLKDAAHSVGVRTHETDTWAVTHSANGGHELVMHTERGTFGVASVSSPDALRNLRTTFGYDERAKMHAAQLARPNRERVSETATGREGTHVETRTFTSGALCMVVAFDDGLTEEHTSDELTSLGRANGEWM